MRSYKFLRTGLEGFRKFLSKCAVAALWRARTASKVVVRGFAILLRRSSCIHAAGRTSVPVRGYYGLAWALAARLRGLRWIRAEKAVFERGSVESTDNSVHFFLIWRFDKCEALRLLRFGVANDLDIVGD